MKHTLKFEVMTKAGPSFSCPVEASSGFFKELADEVEPTQAGISLTLTCMSRLAGFLSKNASRQERTTLKVSFNGDPILIRQLTARDFFNRFTLVHRSGLIAQSIAQYLDDVISLKRVQL